MFSRKLNYAALTLLVLVGGCRHSTSNRVAYSTQPAIVTAAPAPVAVVAPSCSTCPTAGVVPPPPAGFVR